MYVLRTVVVVVAYETPTMRRPSVESIRHIQRLKNRYRMLHSTCTVLFPCVVCVLFSGVRVMVMNNVVCVCNPPPR